MFGIYKRLFFIFVFASSLVQAQDRAEYMIRFANKNGSNYATSNPSVFLSARAINRRIKQGIAIKTNDLPINQWYIDSIAATGVKILNRSKWLNAITIDTIGYPNALSKILSFPFVTQAKSVGITVASVSDAQKKSIEQNRMNKFGILSTITTPPSYNYGGSLNQNAMIGADCMHGNGFTGEGIVIAVLDAGFYNADTLPAFDSLRANNQILGTRDFVDGGTSVYEDYFHGMMVLSTMGGNLPGQLIGTAPKAKFWLLRTEAAATENIIEEFNWAAAAEFADSAGADMINSSLGYFDFDDASQNHTYSDLNGKVAYCSIAATTAAEKGMIVVVSAGNSGPGYIGAPADADSILTVGAVDANGILASFSSHGPSADRRVKPDIAAKGRGSTLESLTGPATTGSGTSFSSPIAAGGIACLWQANPTKTNMQIIEAVRESANQFNSPDSLMGYGIPNMCKANLLLNGIKPDNVVLSYPNPFETAFHIVFSSKDSQTITIELFDIRGRKIMDEAKSVNANSINYFTLEDVAALARGMYILKISASTESFYKKIIKN